MKKDFLELVFDFVDKYPQFTNNQLNYTFSGSVASNLLSFVSGKKIRCYNFLEYKITNKSNEIKVDALFKNFFRPMTDIDIELYNTGLFSFKEELPKEKIILKDMDFKKYASCFRSHIEDLYLDVLRTKSKVVFEIKLYGRSIWIEDIRLNFGYRLKTFAKLSEDRFVEGHPKYEFTKEKYNYDFNYMCKIYFHWFGKENTIHFIEHGLHIFADEFVENPNKLHLNILIKRIKNLNLLRKNETFLLQVIENLKLKFYSNLFYEDDIFLLNEFYNVSEIDQINLGKSKNQKYKIKIYDKKYLLKSNIYLTENELENRVKIVKRINKYLPDNSQHLVFSGYSKKLNESYICYDYIEGKALTEYENKDLFALGLKTGLVLDKFHHIPTKGLILKDENAFLNKIKCSVDKLSFDFQDEKLL